MNKKQQEAKTIQTYDNVAQHWSKSHAVVNDWEWVAQRFKQLLPLGKVLEIGCGGGRDASVLLGHGYEYLGTDASTGMLRVARQQVPSARFLQCSVYDLADLQTTFDGLWACAVLLHIPKERMDEALVAIGTSLKPGAIGMISMKDGNKEEFEVRDKHGWHEERLFVYWSKDEFTDVLTKNGFSVIDYVYKPLNQRTKWHVFFVQKLTQL